MNKRSRVIIAQVVLGLVLACGLIGCRPANPLNQKISANSSVDHRLWRAHVQGSLTQAQWADFDEAIQELTLKIMAEHVATLSAEVEKALLQKIHGRALCEILTEGFQFKLSRLTEERADLARRSKINASLRTRPGDLDSAYYLKDLHQEEIKQLAELDAKITQLKEKLQAYGPAVGSQAPGK